MWEKLTDWPGKKAEKAVAKGNGKLYNRGSYSEYEVHKQGGDTDG
ncbi:hypothetical protein IMSAGC003_03997 [Lachnospiraceae bacterium]|jgi:hypothetical protein|nr:hypothetical protein [Acetatifactor sp.]GFH97426.1 hypothetical protein IMSAGC003_03997 [Lachnospiraceae bacterium]